MSYTPSEAAVEVVARALFVHEWEPSGFLPDYDHDVVEYWESAATAALVAFMGATVPAEPCAMCGGSGTIPVKRVRGRVAVTVDETCRWCPSPRSLAVVECEATGVLEARVALVAVNPTVTERWFRAAAPSTGSPT